MYPTTIPQWDSNRAQDPGVIISPFAEGFDLAPITAEKLRCAGAGCTNVGTKKCGRCNSSKYCSRQCQIQDWKQRHKHRCNHPDTESTWVGRVPASWLITSPLSPTTFGSLICPRLVYDQSQREIGVEYPAIMSMASRPSLRGRLENHSPDTDGSFGICISGGQGAFISMV
jgi:hypothetical protein